MSIQQVFEAIFDSLVDLNASGRGFGASSNVIDGEEHENVGSLI